MKKVNLKSKVGPLALIILFGVIISITSETYAQTFSSGINPSVIKIKAKSPSSVKSPIIIQNSSDQKITYSIFLRPFEANSDLNGEPNFDPSLNSEYESFFTKVKVLDGENEITELSFGPNEKKELTLSIDIEDNSEARDYYFTVVFLSKAEAPDVNTSTIYSRGGIGTNILMSVDPETESNGRIAIFSSPRLIGGGPIEFKLEAANHSNHFVTSKGTLTIKNMFGQTVGNIELEPTNILSNSNRLMTSTDGNLSWDQKFMFGFYKAEIKLALSENGPLLNESRTFFAIPFKAIFIAVSVLLISIWLIRLAKAKKESI